MVCVRQLEDVLVLQTLLLVPPPQGAAGGAATQCSIKALLEGGTGGLSRRISSGIHRQAYKKGRHFLVMFFIYVSCMSFTSFMFIFFSFSFSFLSVSIRLRLHKTDSPIFITFILIFMSVCEGGVADSVSKWVFKHSLAPERLKEILQKKEDKEAEDRQKAGGDQKEPEEKRQEDADRTAGQD